MMRTTRLISQTLRAGSRAPRPNAPRPEATRPRMPVAATPRPVLPMPRPVVPAALPGRGPQVPSLAALAVRPPLRTIPIAPVAVSSTRALERTGDSGDSVEVGEHTPPEVFHAIFGGTGEDDFDTLTGRPTVGEDASSARRFGEHLPDSTTHFERGPMYGGRDSWLAADLEPDEALGGALAAGVMGLGEGLHGSDHAKLLDVARRKLEAFRASGARKLVTSSFSRGGLQAHVFHRLAQQEGIEVAHHNDLDSVHATPEPGMSLDLKPDGTLVGVAQADNHYPANVRHVSQIRARDEQRRLFDSPVRRAEDPTRTRVVTTDVPGTHKDVGGMGDRGSRELTVAHMREGAKEAGLRVTPGDKTPGELLPHARASATGFLENAIRWWGGTKTRDPAI